MTDRLTPAPDRFPDTPRLGIGMIGYALMGKAHTNALIKISHMMYPAAAIPVLESISGRTESAVARPPPAMATATTPPTGATW